jgi:hypothetical protein
VIAEQVWYTGHGPQDRLEWVSVTERPVPVTGMFVESGQLMDRDFAAIRGGLWRLQFVPIEPGDLAAEAHQYRLNLPLTQDQVRAFEVEHGIVLPSEYRAFLTLLGNGGAGPGYGLEKLGHTMGGVPWSEIPGMVGDLAVPFPYTAAWNEVPIDGSRPIEEQYRQQDEYWSSRLTGAIPICEHGCQLREWLIVTGPERGYIWHDGRCDWAGLAPHTTSGRERLTFLEWYRLWLDECLTKTGRFSAEPGSADVT